MFGKLRTALLCYLLQHYDAVEKLKIAVCHYAIVFKKKNVGTKSNIFFSGSLFIIIIIILKKDGTRKMT